MLLWSFCSAWVGMIPCQAMLCVYIRVIWDLGPWGHAALTDCIRVHRTCREYSEEFLVLDSVPKVLLLLHEPLHRLLSLLLFVHVVIVRVLTKCLPGHRRSAWTKILIVCS